MNRYDEIALFWKKANPTTPPAANVDLRSLVDPAAQSRWEQFKRDNPIKGYDRDQTGVPVALQNMFTEEEMSEDQYRQNTSLSRVPTSLRGMFTDTQLYSDTPISSVVNNPESEVVEEEASGSGPKESPSPEKSSSSDDGGEVFTRSGPAYISASKLYGDLKAGISDTNLCIAMVANAKGESGLSPYANGDCSSQTSAGIDTSSRIAKKVFLKPGRRRCCSFGLWQYNICGGLGGALLKHYGASSSSTDREKIAILTSYDKQLKFMIMYTNRKAGKYIGKNKSVDWWVAWFVNNVERPADRAGAITKRPRLAKGLELG
jgi:hypothetical protein